MSQNEEKINTEHNNKENCKKTQNNADEANDRTLKITTESSAYFFIPRFDSKDVSYQEKLPKNFKQFEALVDKIYNNLEETENVFINQAKAVADRDVELINQRFKLQNLQECLRAKKQIYENIDQSLQFVVNLCGDLHNIVGKMEKELDNSPYLANGLKFTPDRMHVYDLVLKMNLKQKDMLQQISDSIIMMNDVIGNSRAADPIGKITKILNLHTETLEVMERKIIELEEELRSVKSLRDYYVTLQNQILSNNQ